MADFLFVDSRVRGIETLLAQLIPPMRVVILSADTDGVEQIAASLHEISGLQAIHILSHGSSGALALGSTVLTSANIEAHKTKLAQLGVALEANGDILLYGCNVAEGSDGRQFIEALAQATGADVAASSNLTGLGGDWQLEVATGSIESAILNGDGYAATLDILTGGSAADILTGTSGADTLNGLEGNDTLTGGGGNDTIDGGAGTDTSMYAGVLSGYRFGVNGSNQLTVTDIDTAAVNDGVDTLINVERTGFTDVEVVNRQYAETRVNSTTALSQTQPTVAGLSGGGYVVAWVSTDGNADGVYAQRYDASGAAVGGETRINTTTVDHQHNPTLAALPDGGYLVSWESNAQDGSGYGIYAQRFNASGGAVGVETRINTTTANQQLSPALAVLTGGGYVAAWHSPDSDGDGVYAQRYNASGAAVGVETRINTTTVGSQQSPVIAGLTDGGYVVSWVSVDDSALGVYLQRYDAQGVTVGGQTRVNTTTIGDQYRPVIAALGDGGYLVVFAHAFGGILYSQRYDASGTAVGGETLLVGASPPGYFAITVLTDGGYVVSWDSNNQDSNIYAQRYDANGVAAGAETRVNTTTADLQQYPAIAALADGGYVVTWESHNQDGNGTGIYSQRFDASGNVWQLSGDGGANTLTWSGTTGVALEGGAGNDTLTGGSGTDRLIGGAGSDAMAGAAGDDFYSVTDSGDSITEVSGAGNDTVSSTVTYTLSAHVENLILSGTSPLNGTGSPEANTLKGNSAGNLLSGDAGNDTFIGGGGADTLDGGSGADAASYAAARGAIVANISTGTITGADGSDILISIEDLIGSAYPDSLTGDGNANRIDGGGGIDTMTGGDGDDTYVVDNIGDIVIEGSGAGVDTVLTGLTYTLPENVEKLTLTGTAGIDGTGNSLANFLTGNEANNRLTGLDGADVLQGMGGADTLVGGTGNDIYFADGSDVIVEFDGQGQDTVYAVTSLTLANFVENVVVADASVILIVGNALNNFFEGNSGNNQFDGAGGNDTLDGGVGDDLLDGGTGSDSLIGGVGDDVYIVDSSGDVVVEAANAGNADKVRAAIEDYQLGAELENLDLATGIARGFGNAKANTLTGNIGNNILDGGQGADRLEGGQGADTYYVDDAGDEAIEIDNTPSGSSGLKLSVDLGSIIDTVIASVNYALGNYLENLTLAPGTSALTGTGNVLANAMVGNAGNNTLEGGGGNDTIEGGSGVDRATFRGNRVDFTVTQVTGGYTVTDHNAADGDEGTDTLTSIERLAFADVLVNISGNTAPVTGAYPNQAAAPGQGVSLNVGSVFSDPDGGDALSFGATGLPSGLGINSSTGVISGTAPSNLGIHHISVTGTDITGEFATLNFDLSIVTGHPLTVNVITREGTALPAVTAHELISTTENGSLYSFRNIAIDINASTGAKTLTAEIFATGTGSEHQAAFTLSGAGGATLQGFQLTGLNTSSGWNIAEGHPANGYSLNATHTSGVLATDVSIGKLTLLLPATATGNSVLDLTSASLGHLPSASRAVVYSQVDMQSTGQLSAVLPDSNVALSLARGTADFLVNGVTKPITAADALDALKLSVGLNASKGSSWKELVAADMTHDGRVTAADALEILKTSVGINTIQPSWVFVPTGAGINPDLGTMTRTAVSYKDEFNLPAINAATSASITGILVGDVNNSWVIPT